MKWLDEVNKKGTEMSCCVNTVHLQDPSWFFFLTIFILKNQQKKHLLVTHFYIMVVNM